MPIPEHAKKLIAQAIDHSAVAYSLARHPGNLQRVVDAIERALDGAGYIVLTREDLADKVEEGSEEANYEDGQ